MKSIELINTDFKTFVREQLPVVNNDGYADGMTLFAVNHVACDVTSAILIRPLNWEYNCVPDFNLYAHNDWERHVSEMLTDGGYMKKEFKQLGISRKEIPMFMLNFYGADDYCNKNLQMNLRCFTYLIPRTQVNLMFEFIKKWEIQLSQFAFLECSEAELNPDLSVNPTLETDYNIFFTQMAGSVYKNWHGKNGILPRLQDRVSAIENGASKDLALSNKVKVRLGLAEPSRELFYASSRYKAFAADNSFEENDVNRPINLGVLDLIFCLQCRLVRLLENPHYFPTAKDVLKKQQAVIAKIPMSPDLPYDPLGELSSYIALMLERYPILGETAFSADAFLIKDYNA